MTWDGHLLKGTLGGPLLGDTLRLSAGHRGAAGEVRSHVLRGGRVRLRLSGELSHARLDLRLPGCLLGEPLQAEVRRSLLEGRLGNGSTECRLYLTGSGGQLQGQVVSAERRSLGVNLRGDVPLTVAAVAVACAYACLYENEQHSCGDGGTDGDCGDGGGADGGGGGE